MNEIQIGSRTKLIEVMFQFLAGKRRLKSEKRFNSKDGVVKVASTGAIRESAVIELLGGEKVMNKLGRFSQHLWSEACHLQHLESNTHAALMVISPEKGESILAVDSWLAAAVIRTEKARTSLRRPGCLVRLRG